MTAQLTYRGATTALDKTAQLTFEKTDDQRGSLDAAFAPDSRTYVADGVHNEVLTLSVAKD